MSQHNHTPDGPPPNLTWDPRLGRWVPMDLHGTPPQKPKRRGRVIGAIIGAAAFIGLVSQCTPDEQSGAQESQSVYTAAAPATSTTAAPRTSLLPQSVEVPDVDMSVENSAMSAVFPTFIESTGISISEQSARVIAIAACNVLRDVSYPGDPGANSVLYGMGQATIEEYPSLTITDSSTIIGAGVLVYCPEFEGSFG